MRSVTPSLGLGLRYEFLDALLNLPRKPCQILEIAPENWLSMGGRRAAYLREYAKQYVLYAHGLSLSLGGPLPLNQTLLKQLKNLFQSCGIQTYSEHLSFCTDEQGHLYDLFPLPFSEEAVLHTAKRIQIVQEQLEMKIAIENISYYYQAPASLSELEFIVAVLQEANCDLLLDVNNVYVNSVNHGYDPYAFIRAIPSQCIRYVHVAGHEKQSDFILDTHGDFVSEPVWALLKETYAQHGVLTTILERDNAIPELSFLIEELQTIERLQQRERASCTHT